MITERHFASSFPAFWRDLVPLLTPSRVRILNSGHEVRMCNAEGVKLPSIASHAETRDSAVVSEFAYHLALKAISRSLTVREAFEDREVRASAQKGAIDIVSKYEDAGILPTSTLNDGELDEGLKLALRYDTFVYHHGRPEDCTFQLPIQGAGFLPACKADLALGDYLVEIKTVKRSLAGKDIRQLIVYLALSKGPTGQPWRHAGFFNPRRATYHKFETRELIDLISGGKTAVEVFADLRDFICSSDVQIDGTF